MGEKKTYVDDGMQGEGNKDAARRYNEQTREFIEEGKVDEAAEQAQPRNEAEAKAMRDAERAGKDKAKR